MERSIKKFGDCYLAKGDKRGDGDVDILIRPDGEVVVEYRNTQ